jgi:hypothetical protein
MVLNENKMTHVQNLIDGVGCSTQNIKRIRKDNSLIERMESEKIILAEDNRQLLFS